MKLRLAAPSLLVDLRKVPGLHGVEREDGNWRIGALTPHATLEHTPELGRACRPVAGTIADPQVRNRGTIGGSLAHGDPASDLPAAMLICEGEVTLQGADGAADGRRRPTCSATTWRPRSSPAEVLTEVRIAGARRLGLRLPEVQPPQRGLGDGRGQRARQGDRRRLRGRAGRV